MHEKHRERMRAKIISNANSLEDHELLEILLFYAIPRKNTNEIAHRLISVFGSLKKVFEADSEMLVKVHGIGEETAAFLKTMGTIMNKCKDEKDNLPAFFSFEKIRKPVQEMFKSFSNEVFIAFFLDKKQKILTKQVLCDHNVSSVEIDLAEFTKFIIAHKPAYIVLAHNHLSGNATPTSNDDETTVKLSYISSLYGASLVDHLIVTTNDVFSYYYENRIDKINERVKNKF